MTAAFGGDAWTAWELPDGRWALSYGTTRLDEPQAIKADWTDARHTAERLRTRSPRSENPVHPLIAGAAAAGAAAVVRNALLANPAPRNHYASACAQAGQVRARIPAWWLTAPLHCDAVGATAFVRPGFRDAVIHRLAGLPFRVAVIERTPRPLR